MIISLSNLSFYCHHGLYEEETRVGGTYIVDTDIEIKTPTQPIQSLEETVNYVAAYDTIRQRMMQPTALLETIVMELGNALIQLSPLIYKVTVTIRKMALPIPGFQGNTAVKFSIEK